MMSRRMIDRYAMKSQATRCEERQDNTTDMRDKYQLVNIITGQRAAAGSAVPQQEISLESTTDKSMHEHQSETCKNYAL